MDCKTLLKFKNLFDFQSTWIIFAIECLIVVYKLESTTPITRLNTSQSNEDSIGTIVGSITQQWIRNM